MIQLWIIENKWTLSLHSYLITILETKLGYSKKMVLCGLYGRRDNHSGLVTSITSSWNLFLNDIAAGYSRSLLEETEQILKDDFSKELWITF